MNRYQKDSFVDAGSFPLLKRILTQWIEHQRRYTAAMHGEDYPWYYRERTCIGFLAAAAWSCGCVVLEEWHTEKRVRALSKAKKPKLRKGRSDLYIHHPSQELFIESKYALSRATGNPDRELGYIKGHLTRATSDCGFLDCHVKHQLGIVFLVPFYPAQKRDGMSDHLAGWLRQVCDEVPHSAAAWLFLDRTGKTFSAGDDAWPGIVLLARSPK